VSANPDLYERSVRYHDQGLYRSATRMSGFELHHEEFLGENLRISEFTGACALAQLEKLDRITGALRANYKLYRDGVAAIPGLNVQPVNDAEGALATRWGLLFDDAETCARFSAALRPHGLSPGLMYGGKPVYMQPKILNQVMHVPEANPWTWAVYQGTTRGYHAGLCPRSEDIMQRVLLVCSANALYTERDVDALLDILKKVAREILG